MECCITFGKGNGRTLVEFELQSLPDDVIDILGSILKRVISYWKAIFAEI